MAWFGLRSCRSTLIIIMTISLLYGVISQTWLNRILTGSRRSLSRHKYTYVKDSLSAQAGPSDAGMLKPDLESEIMEATTEAAERERSGSGIPVNMSLETYERLLSSGGSDPERTDPIKRTICENLHRPVMTAENGTLARMKPTRPDRWQPVRANSSWVFSAHRDPRYADRLRIRVLGVMATDVIHDSIHNRLYCQLWNTTRFIVVVPGTVRALNLKNNYSSFMLICDFYTELTLNHSQFLTVTKFPCIRPTNALHINDNSHVSSPYHKFAVCLRSAIDVRFSDHRRFIEWMELTTMLGSKKATVYTSQVSQNTLKLLTYYNRKGLLNIVTWNELDLQDGGQATGSVLLNDCLYRNLKRTVYLATLALDETLAPLRLHLYGWEDLIRCACCVNNSYVAAMRANFDPRQEDDPRYGESEFISKKTRLLTLLKTERSEELTEADIGGSALMKTSMIDSLGDGHVEFVFNIYLEPCLIPECIALLYTYRELDDNQTGQNNKRTTDNRLQKYGSLLSTSVSIVHKELMKEYKYLVA